MCSPRFVYNGDVHQGEDLYAEASEVRLPPGQWPKTIIVEIPAIGRGETLFTFRHFDREDDGDISGACYRSEYIGRNLWIAND